MARERYEIMILSIRPLEEERWHRTAEINLLADRGWLIVAVATTTDGRGATLTHEVYMQRPVEEE